MAGGTDKLRRPEPPETTASLESTTVASCSRTSPVGGNALAALELSRTDERVCRGPISAHDLDEMLWRERIGEASTTFDKIGHVNAPLGVRLRRGPHAGSPELGIIPFDTRVHIQRRTSHGWAYVTVVAQDVGAGSSELVGQSGFIEGRFVLLNDPVDSGGFLHLVRPGEGAARVAAHYYAPPGGFTTGYDAYLFVSALWEVNQHLDTAEGPYASGVTERPVELSRGQTLIRFEDQEQSLRTYLGARLRAGHALWIPSLAKVRALMRAGTITSATPLAGFGEQGGFLRGLASGIEDGLRDLVEQAKQIAQLLWDLLNDGLIDMLIKLAKKISALISQFDVSKALAAGKKMALDFLAKWTDEDAFLRGHFQGKVIGYLIVLILPMVLTEGIGELAAAPRALGALEELSAVADSSEVVAELSSSLKQAKLGERLTAAIDLRREGLVAEPFEGGFTAIEERFDPHLDELFPEDEPWGGFVRDRMQATKFRPDERRINFQLNMSMNKFSVAEEVQHAIDYTLGAKSEAEIFAEGTRLGIPEGEINDWWHRRVFTRMIKNIHEGKYGLGYLQPRIAEVYARYQLIGGKLTLEQILSTTWEGIY